MIEDELENDAAHASGVCSSIRGTQIARGQSDYRDIVVGWTIAASKDLTTTTPQVATGMDSSFATAESLSLSKLKM